MGEKWINSISLKSGFSKRQLSFVWLKSFSSSHLSQYEVHSLKVTCETLRHLDSTYFASLTMVALKTIVIWTHILYPLFSWFGMLPHLELFLVNSSLLVRTELNIYIYTCVHLLNIWSHLSFTETLWGSITVGDTTWSWIADILTQFSWLQSLACCPDWQLSQNILLPIRELLNHRSLSFLFFKMSFIRPALYTYWQDEKSWGM